jgi:uncharacterized protein (TIGR02145 family)
MIDEPGFEITDMGPSDLDLKIGEECTYPLDKDPWIITPSRYRYRFMKVFSESQPEDFGPMAKLTVQVGNSFTPKRGRRTLPMMLQIKVNGKPLLSTVVKYGTPLYERMIPMEDIFRVEVLIRYANGMPVTINILGELLNWTCGRFLVDDRDKQAYTTTQIGQQCWMAENLNIGNRIHSGLDQSDNGIIEKYCYNNLDPYCEIYGGMYQWNEAMNYTEHEKAQGICPDGWHIPDHDERGYLFEELYPDAGSKMKETGTKYWLAPNANATNESGFSARAGGYRDEFGTFRNLREIALFWISSTSENFGSPYTYILYHDVDWINSGMSDAMQALSVRCIRNPEPGTRNP